MKQILDVMYTYRDGKVHVAARSVKRDVIIAIGTFPHNCPREAIKTWLRGIEMREVARETMSLESLALA